MEDLVPVIKAAERAGVSNVTMRRAARTGAIKAIKLGRDWFIYVSDIERWKREEYRPDMAHRYPVEKDDETDEN